jgi:ribosomal protein S18 acetylase RimI-like enzyme
VVTVVEADLRRAAHRRAFLQMFDSYVRDPMEAGRPLAPRVRRALVAALLRHPTTHVFVAYCGGAPVGMAVCFTGFSTFAARPLMNIHDIGVARARRGQGVGRRLVEAIAAKARRLGCCKLTLEVRRDNRPARRLYRRVGFAQVTERDGRVPVEFWEMRLTTASAANR